MTTVTRLLCAIVVLWAVTMGAAPALADSCPNAGLRQANDSTGLPDCRAYELVSAPDTNGSAPKTAIGTLPEAGAGLGPGFNSPTATPDGSGFLYGVYQTEIPGTSGNGIVNTYHAARTVLGWESTRFSPTGDQARLPAPGGYSPDEHYFSFQVDHVPDQANGSLDSGTSSETMYVRYPDGSYHLVGKGTLSASPDSDGILNGTADDVAAQPEWISPDGAHIIFRSTNTSVKLLPDSPDSPSQAVYDRTPAGLKLLSLLPGDTTPTVSSNFAGASRNGSVGLFTTTASGGTPPSLYARVDDNSTIALANGSTMPVGGTLTCSVSGAGTTTQFQWLRNGAAVPGATASTYKTAAADRGSVVQCQVFTFQPGVGMTQASRPGVGILPTPVTAPPANTPGLPPVVSASATLDVGGAGGQTLTCDPGTWSGSPTFAYRWYRNGVALSGNGAETSVYSVQAADLATPAIFQCEVVGSDAGGGSAAVSGQVDSTPAPGSNFPGLFASTNNGALASGGVSDDGKTVFWDQAGNLFALDVATQQLTPISTSGDAQFVNISDDGSHVFFTSRSQLDGSNGVVGQPNLYVWGGASVKFIATVTTSDLTNLGQWSSGVLRGPDPPVSERSRSTPDGSVLAFQSNARLTAYDNAGQTEIYRYDTRGGSLSCVSCDPEGRPAVGGARFAATELEDVVGTDAVIPNLSDDGQTVFFESFDDLLPSDHDGLLDVYEWHAGQLFLISPGNDSQNDYLMGATPDGTSVFFRTAEALFPNAQDPGVPAIYAARVDGGFPVNEPAPLCAGDSCQGSPTPAPTDQTPGSVDFSGPGNPKPAASVGRAALLTRAVRGVSFMVRVRVPAGGSVTISGAAIRPIRRALTKAGIYRMRLALTPHARRALARKQLLKIRLRLAFVPASGKKTSARPMLTVRAARSGHARRVQRPTTTTRRAGQ